MMETTSRARITVDTELRLSEVVGTLTLLLPEL